MDVFIADELLESLDRDHTDWSRRAVIKLISMQALFRSEIRQIENKLESVSKKQKWSQMLGSGLSVVGTTASGIQLLRELVIRRDGSIKPSLLNFVVLIGGFACDTILTSIMGYTSTQSYDQQVILCGEIVTEYFYLIHAIENEIYKKSDMRESVQTLFGRINHSYEKLIKKQSNVLGLKSLKPLEDGEGSQLNIEMSNRRKSTEMVTCSSSDHEDKILA